jgi:hypothetical protein
MKSGHAARLRTALPSAAVAVAAAAAAAVAAVAAAAAAGPAAEPAAEPPVYPPSRPPPSPPPIPHAAEPAANPACSRARHRASHWPIQTCRPPRPGSPTLVPAKFRCYSAIQQNFDVSSLYSGLYTAKIRCIALYTDTRCVTALRSYTAIQRYTLYSCTALYTIYVYNLYNPPLSLCVFPSTRTAHTLCAPASASASLYKRRRRQFPLHSRDRLEFNPWRFSLVAPCW